MRVNMKMSRGGIAMRKEKARPLEARQRAPLPMPRAM